MSHTMEFLEELCRTYLGPPHMALTPFFLQITSRGGLQNKGIERGCAADVRFLAADMRGGGGGAFRIRIANDRRPFWLDDTMHELGHIVLGHVAPYKTKTELSDDPYTKGLARRVLAGELLHSEAMKKLGDYVARLDARIREIRAANEREANVWAELRVGPWRPLYQAALERDGYFQTTA